VSDYTKEEFKCVVRGTPYATKHHIYSCKAHPALASQESNMIPICDELDKMWKSQGTIYMQNKFPDIRRWLIANGWEFDPVLWKWVNYELLKIESSGPHESQYEQQSSRPRRIYAR
jgi:hypothetical protein